MGERFVVVCCVLFIRGSYFLGLCVVVFRWWGGWYVGFGLVWID